MNTVKALFTIDNATPAEVFVGYHDPGNRWNGWATPSFERSVIEQIITQINADQTDEEYHRFEWDGDTLVHYQPAYAEAEDHDRLEPDAEGRYGLGAFGWTWSELEPDDDEVAAGFDETTWIAYHEQRREIYQAVYDATLASTGFRLLAKEAGYAAVDAIAQAGDPAYEVPAWFMPMLGYRTVAWAALGVERQLILINAHEKKEN